MVADAGEGGARRAHRLPDVGHGQAHHPAATTGIQRQREHHRTHPQEARRQGRRLPRPHTATQGPPRRSRPHARRLPKGRKPTAPSEIIQLDTLSLTLDSGRSPIKRFTACDPVTKWTCAQACRNATAHNAKRLLDKLQADMPFPAIQVDGGSEFKADFERECQKRGIDLFELPPRGCGSIFAKLPVFTAGFHRQAASGASFAAPVAMPDGPTASTP